MSNVQCDPRGDESTDATALLRIFITARDGSWRALEVKVTPTNGPKKLYVRSKRGYYAPKA